MSLKVRLREWMECDGLRILAIILPWKVFYGMAKLLSRTDWLLQTEVLAAWDVAFSVDSTLDERIWKSRHRLSRIVDRVDAFVARKKSDAWLLKRMIVSGHWPEQACVAVTFHFGTGVWALRHMRSNGLRSAFLSAPISPVSLECDSRSCQFELLHLKAVEEATGMPAVFVGGSLEKMRRLLRDDVSIVGLIDVPNVNEQHRLSARLLKNTASFPSGLIYLAETMGVPLVVFTCELDYGSGKHLLNIHNIHLKTADTMQSIVDVLDEAIKRNSSAWHFWQNLNALWKNPKNYNNAKVIQ